MVDRCEFPIDPRAVIHFEFDTEWKLPLRSDTNEFLFWFSLV